MLLPTPTTAVVPTPYIQIPIGTQTTLVVLLPQRSRHFCYRINPLVWTPMDLARSTGRDLERREHINETSAKLRGYKEIKLPF